MARIGIIGMGWVGSSVAISTLDGGVSELLLHDIRSEIAEGDAMDLAHGARFYPSASVRTAEVEEMADADAVVIAAGRGVLSLATQWRNPVGAPTTGRARQRDSREFGAETGRRRASV